jgi:hypothetical protein
VAYFRAPSFSYPKPVARLAVGAPFPRALKQLLQYRLRPVEYPTFPVCNHHWLRLHNLPHLRLFSQKNRTNHPIVKSY